MEGHDERDGLTELHWANQRLWVGRLPLAPGSHQRLQVRARDVSVSLSNPADSSILNVIPARIADLQSIDEARCLLRLVVDDQLLLAQVSHRSARRLRLCNGQSVYAQVKALSVLGPARPAAPGPVLPVPRAADPRRPASAPARCSG